MARTGYPANTWNLLRSLYETGTFSIPALHEYCTRTLKKCPSVDAIKKKAARDKWREGIEETKKEIQEKVRESTLDIFTRLGMPPERALELVINGMECSQSERARLGYTQEYIKLIGMYAPEKHDHTSLGGPIGVPVEDLDLTKLSTKELRDYKKLKAKALNAGTDNR